MEIKQVSLSDLDSLKEFIENIPSIENLDDDILKNASVIYGDEGICGCLSFEKYGAMGLIRYFIFKKNVSDYLIEKLFRSLSDRALRDGINRLYCIAEAEEIKNLFQEMGFSEIDKDLFFIEEECFSSYNYEKALVMEKMIE